MSVRLSPVLAGLGTYPFVRLEQARARLRAAGVEHHRLRDGRAARGDARVHPRGARGRDHAAGAVPERGRAARAARARSPAGRRAASAPRWTRTPRSSRRSAPRRPCSRSRNVFDGDVVAVPTPVVPGLRARRGVRRQARSSSCRCARRTAGCRTSTASTGTRRRRSCGSTTRTTRPAPARRWSSTSTPPRWRASTASCSPPTRPTRSSTSPASRRVSALQVADRSHVARVQHAVQALVDAGLPLRVRRRRPGDHRRAEEVPAERRRRAAGVRPARRDRRLGRRDPRRRGARALPGQARGAAARAGGASACATRAATRRSSSGWTPARTPTRWPRAGSRRAWSSRPGSFFGAPGYLRIALVPPPEACARAAEIIRGLA